MHPPQSRHSHFYSATPTPELKGAVTIVFRNLPEAIAYGDDEEVRAMDAKVLELAVAERMGRGDEFPAGSAAKPSYILVRLRPLLAAKAALHNALKQGQITKSELARWLQIERPVSAACFSPAERRG